MHRTSILIAALALSLPVLAGGCTSVKEQLGLTKQSPDEFSATLAWAVRPSNHTRSVGPKRAKPAALP